MLFFASILGACSIDTALTPPADVGSVGSIAPVAGYRQAPSGPEQAPAAYTVPVGETLQPAPAPAFQQATGLPPAPRQPQQAAAPNPQEADALHARIVSVLDSDQVVEGATSEPVVAGIGTADPHTINGDEGGPQGAAGTLPDAARRPGNGAGAPAPQTAFNLRPVNPADPFGNGASAMSEPAPAMPASEVACRAQLKRLGVRYTELPRISSGPACGIDYPIRLTGLSGGIRIKPAATLNCPVTVEFAKWIKRDVAPAARARYLSGIKSITQLSSYSCRTMNSQKGAPMSEHAHGNAIDIGKFTLDSGRQVDVRKPGFFAFRQRGFLNSVRTDSCGYFNTVLGPGTNKYHWNHFHFDLRQRSSGRSYCE